MSQVNTSGIERPRTHGMWVAWLIAGTLDIAAAIVQTLIAGRDPVMMLKFIATGVFGPKALQGDIIYAVTGLVFHYAIAWIWTWLFFALYKRLKGMRANTWLSGIGYGLFVWVIMNRLVLPLSNTPPLPFTLKGALTGASILILAIGMPLSFLAKRMRQ